MGQAVKVQMPLSSIRERGISEAPSNYKYSLEEPVNFKRVVVFARMIA